MLILNIRTGNQDDRTVVRAGTGSRTVDRHLRFSNVVCKKIVLPQETVARDGHFVEWHRLTLTIHPPISPSGQGPENIQETMDHAYRAVMSAVAPEYQGYVENPDQ